MSVEVDKKRVPVPEEYPAEGWNMLKKYIFRNHISLICGCDLKKVDTQEKNNFVTKQK